MMKSFTWNSRFIIFPFFALATAAAIVQGFGVILYLIAIGVITTVSVTAVAAWLRWQYPNLFN